MRKPVASLSYFFRTLLPVILLSGGFSLARAQEQADAQTTGEENQTGQTQQPHELSEKVSDTLSKQVQPLIEAKKYDEALALIDPLIATAAPTSYDRAVLATTKSQILFYKNDYMGAMEPLETSLKLGETYGYFDKKVCQQFRFYLASLYTERASQSKDPQFQTDAYNKARAYLERWFRVSKDPDLKPSIGSNDLANAEYLYAALLISIAERDIHNIDNALMQKALDAVNIGLRSTLKPTDNFYVLQLAAYQQLERYADAADVLEHLLKTKPDNKTYWQQLTAFYVNLAGIASDKQDDQKALQYNIRAIVTMERAQQHGAMNTPKDNFRLVSIYFNVGQYEQAAELLESGLHSGAIDSTPENWKLLANALQQVHKELKAVEVLHEAAQLYPKSGQFDYIAAQILYSRNDTAGALKAIQACVARDGGEKPWASWQFLVYLAFELQKFDVAGDAVEHLAKYPEAKASEVQGFRDAVKAAIEQRDRASQKAK